MPRKLANREKAVLKHMNARATLNSGSVFGDGDGKITFTRPIGVYGYKSIYVEVKCTDAKSFSIKNELWKKIEHEAHRLGRMMPVLALDIQEKRYAVIELDDFLNLLYDIVENTVEDDNDKES